MRMWLSEFLQKGCSGLRMAWLWLFVQLRVLLAEEQGQHQKDFAKAVLGEETAWAWTEPGVGYIQFRPFSCFLLFSQSSQHCHCA